jgi:hypothetical protein
MNHKEMPDCRPESLASPTFCAIANHAAPTDVTYPSHFDSIRRSGNTAQPGREYTR